MSHEKDNHNNNNSNVSGGGTTVKRTNAKNNYSKKPAHQNSYAFHHNPKSKLTAQILQSPITNVCRRCYDKLEWRKRYRKYKPLTQPSSCHQCHARNVTSAYHTVCTKCTKHSVRAQMLLRQWNDGSTEDNEEAAAIISAEGSPRQRVCAMCFKEPVLPSCCTVDENEEESDDNGAVSRPLKLREIKSLQRQKEKEMNEIKNKKKLLRQKQQQQQNQQQNEQQDDDDETNEDGDTNYSDNDDSDDDDDDEEETQNNQNRKTDDENVICDRKQDRISKDDGDDANDPFLQAVGGKHKLLTGEAYQQYLLRQRMQQIQIQQQPQPLS